MSDQDREAFERDLANRYSTSFDHSYGRYIDEATQKRWEGWQAAKDHYAPKLAETNTRPIDEHADEWAKRKFIELYAAKNVDGYVTFRTASFREGLRRLVIEVYKYSERQRVTPVLDDLQKRFEAALRAAGLRFKEEASSNPEPGASR